MLKTSGGDLAAVVTNLAYPIADLVLLGLLVGGTHMLRGRADRGLILIAVALVLFVVADIVYLYGIRRVPTRWAGRWMPVGRSRRRHGPRRLADRRPASKPDWDPSSRARVWVVGATVAATVVQTGTTTTASPLWRCIWPWRPSSARSHGWASRSMSRRRDPGACRDRCDPSQRDRDDRGGLLGEQRDSAGRLLYVNPMYEQLYDRPAGQLYDDALSWIDAVHPEDRERARAAFATFAPPGAFARTFGSSGRTAGCARSA